MYFLTNFFIFLVNQDYEQTLVAVKAYADSLSVPFKYVLLDSWWYYKGE